MLTPRTEMQIAYINLCNYFWPLLEALWNPSSKIHWTKHILSLKFDGIIPPHAIYAAALHGLWVLRGFEPHQAYTGAIMACFLRPVGRKEWAILNPPEDSELDDEYWLPFGYVERADALLKKSACALKKHAVYGHYNDIRVEKPHGTFKKEVREAMHALDEVFLKIQQKNKELDSSLTQEEVRNEVQRVHHAYLEGISLHEAWETEKKCGICQDNFTDTASSADLLIMEEVKKPANLRNPTSRHSCFPDWEARDMFQNLKAVLMAQRKDLGVSQESAIENLAHDILKFERVMRRARRWLMELRSLDEGRCVHPTKLACGHVMGLGCIVQWIQTKPENPTCPFCRQTLRPAPPAQPARDNHPAVGGLQLHHTDPDALDLDGIGAVLLAEGEIADEIAAAGGGLEIPEIASPIHQGLHFNLADMSDMEEENDDFELEVEAGEIEQSEEEHREAARDRMEDDELDEGYLDEGDLREDDDDDKEEDDPSSEMETDAEGDFSMEDMGPF